MTDNDGTAAEKSDFELWMAKEITYEEYKRREVKAGKNCFECGAIILHPKGYHQRCTDCRLVVEDRDSVTHSNRIRCPKCGESRDPAYDDDGGLFVDGEHDVSCDECGHDFTIQTHVSFTFESPAIIDDEEEE